MTKIVVRVFIILLFVCSKPLVAQTASMFEQAHTQLLSEYIAFIDSAEKKKPYGSYFQIYKHKHVSKVEFSDDKLVYRITKKVKVYKSGVRYEKIDWGIHYLHKRWFHKLYEVKQVGQDYRFIEQINYDFSKKLTKSKITTSFDDNYILINVLSPKDKKATYLYVKTASSLPLMHQN